MGYGHGHHAELHDKRQSVLSIHAAQGLDTWADFVDGIQPARFLLMLVHTVLKSKTK